MISRRLFLAAGSGVLLALAFPDPHWGTLGWIALAPLLAVALDASPLGAFAYGFLAGLLFFGITLRWLYGFFRGYGAMSVPIAAGVLGLMVAILAGFIATYALCARAMKRSGTGWALAASPFFWVGLELLRTHMPAIGFPWNLLGYSVSARLGLVQLVTLTGIYGLSFVVAGYNALLVWAWRERRRKPLAVWAAVTVVLAIVVLFGDRLVPDPAARYTAHLIQLNLRPEAIYPADWEQRSAPQLDALGRMTIAAGRSSPGLVIWPEAPAPFSLEDPQFAARAASIARASQSYFLLGVDEWRYPPGGPPQASNSAVMLDPAGRRVFAYDKIHLVPFGEYVPWRRWLFFARRLTGDIGDFAPGTVRAVGRLPGGTFSVFICYEAIFPGEIRQFADRGAGLLVNISDDGWYGQSEALEQHLNMARVRAVENRRWLLRATNTGLTAVIDPYGRFRARLSPNQRAVLTTGYDFRSERTLYARWGDWWAWLCLVVGVAALAWNIARRSEP
ncbi:MAG TPA: apolipoprotein N-acyltransferase [Candidatus Acidoferrales bacterium]|nr:apolipoprotein N-acyltransferase [Candidatus Acidoferrales bacterium]